MGNTVTHLGINTCNVHDMETPILHYDGTLKTESYHDAHIVATDEKVGIMTTLGFQCMHHDIFTWSCFILLWS